MALSPNQVYYRAKESRAEEVKRLEERIDHGLLQGRRTFALELIGLTQAGVWDDVISLYRAAGWSVILVSDQRDGSYYRFSW